MDIYRMLRSHSFELPTLTCVVNICSCSEIFDNQLFYLDFKDSIYKWFFYQWFKNSITFKPFNKITSTTQSFKTTFSHFYLKLCPKIQFSEKLKNCEFEFLCQKWMKYCDYDTLSSARIWIFTRKNVKIQPFSMFINQITIFGAKIQIIQWIFLKIFGHNLRFSNSVYISVMFIK